jgi:hypothetical protein
MLLCISKVGFAINQSINQSIKITITRRESACSFAFARPYAIFRVPNLFVHPQGKIVRRGAA